MKNLKLALVAAAVAASASGTALAASDGALGGTSQGSSVVTIIKDNAVQITNVADLNLGTFATLASDASASDAVCVFASTGGYSVTLDGGDAVFQLADGANAIPYTLTWAANGGAAVIATPGVAIGTALTPLVGDSTSLNCGGSTNAVFEATVAAATFNAAAPGTYTDTVTLLVTAL